MHEFSFFEKKNIFFIIFLVSCSEGIIYKKQDNGKEFYLKTHQLIPLCKPTGVILPNQGDTYRIPNIGTNGAIGKKLDIRPPVQLLSFIPGIRVQFTEDTAILLLTESEFNNEAILWKEVVNIILSKKYTIDKRDDSNHMLITSWIKWDRKDEDCLYRSRYRISVKQKEHHQFTIKIELLDLEQAGKPATDLISKQRYSAEFLNIISKGLYEHICS